MKAISILQPWATLIVIGAKRIETRSWNTKYRGPLLIHASAKWSKQQSLSIAQMGAYDILIKAGYDWDAIGRETTLPLGAIIGQVDLVDTSTSDILMGRNGPNLPRPSIFIPSLGKEWVVDEREEAFGDYSPGRYGWLLSDPVQFDKPISAKGKLGLWQYELINKDYLNIECAK